MPDLPRVRLTPMAEADVAAAAAIDATSGLSPDSLRAELARPWARIWVARDASGVDGRGLEPLAYAVTWIVVDEVHVLNVATRADRRREGIARALLRHVLCEGGREGARRVLLEVRRSNRPAIALYRALGFFVTGVRTRYYADDEDAVEMALELNPETHEAVVHADEVDAGV